MKKISFLFLGVLLLSLFSCGKSYHFSEKVTIPNATWTYDNTPSFTVDIDDVEVPYNLILELTHSTEYPYQNIYVKLHVTNPTQKTTDSQVSLELAQKTGQWYGDCGSTTCTIQSLLQQAVKFPEKGTYTFKVEQYLREAGIEGIHSVGLSVERLDTKSGK